MAHANFVVLARSLYAARCVKVEATIESVMRLEMKPREQPTVLVLLMGVPYNFADFLRFLFPEATTHTWNSKTRTEIYVSVCC
jgi:hypothetical protein